MGTSPTLGSARAAVEAAVLLPVEVTDHLVGDPGERALVGPGFTAGNLKPAGPDRAEQLERLAREVVPAVRAAGSRYRGEGR